MFMTNEISINRIRTVAQSNTILCQYHYLRL